MKLKDLTPHGVALELMRAVVESRGRTAVNLSPLLLPPASEPIVDTLCAQRVTWAVLLRGGGDTPPASEVRKLVDRAVSLGYLAGQLPQDERMLLQCDLALTAQQLTDYARRGVLGDWPDTSCVHGAVQSIGEVLWGCPGDLLSEPSPVPIDRLAGGIGTVVRAALARSRLASGEAVYQRWLEALGSVENVTVRMAVQRGTLKTTRSKRGSPRAEHGQITHETAVTWLRARKVEGF